MLLKTNLTLKKLENLAEKIEVQIYKLKTYKTYYQFILKPITKHPENKFYRKKLNPEYKRWSCCLHGYTWFMIEVFKQDKKAYFKTALTSKPITIYNVFDMYYKVKDNNPFLAKCFCCDKTIEKFEKKLNETILIVYDKVKK